MAQTAYRLVVLLVGLIVLLQTPLQLQASDAGTTSANFLKIRVSPRAIGMGEAHVAVADDTYATYWNPAGLAQMKVQQVGLTHTEYVENITEQYASYALPQPSAGRTFGLSVTYLGVGSFQGYDAASNPTSQINAYDMAFGASYAQSLFKDRREGSDLMLGVTGKWIREKLDTVSASAVAVDGGLLYIPGKRYGDWLSGVKAGLVFKNLGSGLRFDQDTFDLPRLVAAGLSYSSDWSNHTFNLAFDAQKPQAGRLSYSTGGEIEVTSFFLVRGGYTTEGDLGNGLRVGAGFRIKSLQVDYAYAGVGPFGSAHRLGVTIKFGDTPRDPLFVANEWYRKGVKDFDNGRYNDALVKFNKALEIDPNHPHALEMMNKTYEQIKLSTTQP